MSWKQQQLTVLRRAYIFARELQYSHSKNVSCHELLYICKGVQEAWSGCAICISSLLSYNVLAMYVGLQLTATEFSSQIQRYYNIEK